MGKKEKQRKPKVPFDKRVAALLNVLCHSNKQQQKSLLRGADEPLVRSICECALNVLRGVICLKPAVKRSLKKYKNVLRQLAGCCTGQSGSGRTAAGGKRRKYNWKAKKRLMLQKGCGAFLPLLLAPIFSSLIGRLFSSGEK